MNKVMEEQKLISQRHNFRKLNVWVEAIDLATSVLKAVRKFPEYEKYGIVSQLSRSAISISSNIAEGCSRKSNKHFVIFLETALGSSFELESQLIIAHNIGYLSNADFDVMLNDTQSIQKKLHNLIEKLEKE